MQGLLQTPLSDKQQLAQYLIEYGATDQDYEMARSAPPAELMAAAPKLNIPWPDGLAPNPVPMDVEPAPGDPLPQAEVLVITWTVAELQALADVLTPGYTRNEWYRYDRYFRNRYLDEIRNGAPARKANRLGSYFLTEIGDKSVVCFKSELHLNQDGIRTGDGTATLPVKEMFRQLINEVQPELVITVGTAGATYREHALGDVMITRAAQFRLSDEFANEEFANSKYVSDFEIPDQFFEAAEEMMQSFQDRLREPDFGPPTKRHNYTGALIKAPVNKPKLRVDGHDLPDFHPILTTDFFEFGTSVNGLEALGCGVEMGDAVLGMVADEMGEDAPKWLVIRNASDPQINGDLPDRPRALNMQAHWAVWYYETFGYWTSVMSAIATWAVVAGL